MDSLAPLPALVFDGAGSYFVHIYSFIYQYARLYQRIGNELHSGWVLFCKKNGCFPVCIKSHMPSLHTAANSKRMACQWGLCRFLLPATTGTFFHENDLPQLRERLVCSVGSGSGTVHASHVNSLYDQNLDEKLLSAPNREHGDNSP